MVLQTQHTNRTKKERKKWSNKQSIRTTEHTSHTAAARAAAPHLVINHSEQPNRYCRFSMLSVSCTSAPARVLGEPADGDRMQQHGSRDASRGDDTPPGGRTSNLGDVYRVEQPSAVRWVPEDVLWLQPNLSAHSLVGSSEHDARTTAPCHAMPCRHRACAMPDRPQSRLHSGGL